MTIGSHQQTVGKSQDHITPRWILERLGDFDLDPAASLKQPWPCAAKSFTVTDDGLLREWHGRVFLNPPFLRYGVDQWVARIAAHGNGTLLLHARTEAAWFRPVWRHARSILFLARRIKFCRPGDGVERDYNSGAPVVLAAFGEADHQRLRESGIAGALVEARTWIHARADAAAPEPQPAEAS